MKVGIVGLGAAGLRAAMLLEEAGVQTLLYEARDRIGGRIRTVQRDRAVYEMGAEWIDADHARTLALFEDLGLQTMAGESWPRRLYFEGEMRESQDLWADALEDELRVESAAKELSFGLRRNPWENAARGDLDGRTLDDFLREHTSSARGLWWTRANYRSDEGDDPERIGLLGWLCATLPYREREDGSVSAFRVPGGMGQMIEGMANCLSANAHLGAVLRRVHCDNTSVSLRFEDFEVEVDRAILTVPPSVLEQVVIEPPLLGAARCAIEGVGMSRAVKVVMEFDRPFWRDLAWNGCLMCDTPLQQVWDASLGEAPLLCAYICGEQARSFANRADSVQAVVKELESLIPEASGRFVRGWLHDWVSEPFSHGAFSHHPAGYSLSYHRYLNRAHERIHFAGEHTAQWNGFVEGALESAERVVHEVLNA